MAIALGIVGLSGSVHAEPITWSYTAVNEDTGDLFGSGYNITETDYWSPLMIPKPVFGPFDPDSATGGYYNYRTTTTTRLTITDEASGQSETTLLKWTLGEGWYQVGGSPDWHGHFAYEDLDPHPHDWNWLRLGSHEYGISNDEVAFRVQVRPAPTPEPATLVMGGIGLSVVGLIRARRKRAKERVV